ncbi:MAG: hypothetical protein OXD01_04995 [Gammaproteobacteria bacterium]|nr:hypothetical protein [Gammaproteobacteria bacterium]
MTARHKWLIKWGNQHKQKIIDDAEYFDMKVAGWWVWGISLWIGGGWCAEPVDNRRPTIDPRGGAKGIQALSKRPIIKPSGGFGGTQALQYKNQLVEFIGRLSERLKNVIVLGGDWSKCLGDTPLMHTPDSPKPPVSVLLDPPYLTEKRTTSLYISDIDGTSDHVALQSWKWALDNAQKYKIAYCCHEGDFELPEGWIKHTQKFPSTKLRDKGKQEDCIMFSPLCHSEKPQKEMAL